MSGWRFMIDRGGTFTDIVALGPKGEERVIKLLSEDSANYSDPALEGIRRVLSAVDADSIPVHEIDFIKMGSTVGTNALLERKGARTALLVTEGFRDLLEIGYQERPDIFALNVIKRSPIHETVIEVRERISASGEEIVALDRERLRYDLKKLKASGVRSLAIVLMHGYRHTEHETEAAKIAEEAGFDEVCLSSEVIPLMRIVSRGDTTVADAYLSPIIRDYLSTLSSNVGGNRLKIMKSDGGLVGAKSFRGRDSILSGPAGGIVGAVEVSRRAGFDKLVTFDMGGTSTDVAHFAGEYERTIDSIVAGVRMRTPMLSIHTVAAGGGSILHFDGRRFRVGPDSAGANPGPACYRKGGPLTVTDANLMLGRIVTTSFPKVFGPAADLPPDKQVVKQKFDELAAHVGAQTGKPFTSAEAAEGFLDVAVENMAAALKKVSIEKGHDLDDYTLCAFGGAGGQHACGVADALNIKKILLHPLAGVLSAYGMGLARESVILHHPLERALTEDLSEELEQIFCDLSIAAREALPGGNVNSPPLLKRWLLLRYAGTDSPLEVQYTTTQAAHENFEKSFFALYGFIHEGKALIVEAAMIEGVESSIDKIEQPDKHPEPVSPKVTGFVKAYFSGWRDVPHYERDDLLPGASFAGPAMVTESTSTIIVEEGWQALVDSGNNIVLTRELEANKRLLDTEADPVKIELFNRKFISIAEQMGVTLCNTAHSVNIKERLDFSCAIFDGKGELIANAPHIPVHLGSMSESVRAVIKRTSNKFDPGDVFLLNSPYEGGTHLPDVTIVTPVFCGAADSPAFFTASRGHNKDIVGSTPGSLPPSPKSIEEEGVITGPIKIVSGGRLLREPISNWLSAQPFPARNPDRNMSDIEAQIAANAVGGHVLHKLLSDYGVDVVTAYAGYLLDNGEELVKRVLLTLSDSTFEVEMDGGAAIRVAISIDRVNRLAKIDFTGTATQQKNNLNAPEAVTKAAVLYVFRTLIADDIPLNAGCMRPLEIIIPPGSLLSPRYPAPVAAGNVETSQNIVDCLFGALGILAAGQGTMNNITFGDGEHQYYETICGGCGAGESFDGASAVHCHMTNSRITDPEVMEWRYPVILEEFSIRRGTGGAGNHKGGDGVKRVIKMLQKMKVSILSGRRETVPFGILGGLPGAPGKNTLLKADGNTVALPARTQVDLSAGDRIIIETPGGGGFGEPPKDNTKMKGIK
ncbi:MAG: 5-oxoprolinase [Deltaproteobacteria bacterium]|nr:MAG: 5-oxoprolinase [Deltaproteobacteria bacterium]